MHLLRKSGVVNTKLYSMNLAYCIKILEMQDCELQFVFKIFINPFITNYKSMGRLTLRLGGLEPPKFINFARLTGYSLTKKLCMYTQATPKKIPEAPQIISLIPPMYK